MAAKTLRGPEPNRDDEPFHPMIEAVLASLRADIDALAAYEPRKQAIDWIFGRGQLKYIDWFYGDGAAAAYGRGYSPAFKRKPGYEGGCFFQRMPLDAAVLSRARYHGEMARFDPTVMAFLEDYALRYAREHVADFYRSPFEIVLEHGADLATLDEMMSVWSDPEATCARGSVKTIAGGWEARELYIGDSPERKQLAEDIEGSALVRALVEGRTDIADLLARHRLAGQPDYINARLIHYFHEHREELEALCAEMGIKADLGAADNWLGERDDNFGTLVRLAREPGPWRKIERMCEIAERGACSGDGAVFDMAVANGCDVLAFDLIEGGAEPNGPGIYTGSAIDSIDLVADPSKALAILKAWARAGGSVDGDWANAKPLRMSPSEAWICRDLPEIVERARSLVRVKRPIREKVGGAWRCSLLGLALERDKRKSIRWLIEEQGCRLSDLDTATGKPVRDFAKGDVLAFAVAIEERLALTADPYPTHTDLGSNPKRV